MNDVWLLLKRRPGQSILQFLDEQQNLRSPNYHKWLTTKQMGDQFGPSPEDIQRLEAAGFTVNQLAPHGTLIDFSGTVGQIRQAFHTEIHYIEVNNGERHYANVSDPQIPAALGAVVGGPVSLHHFMPQPMLAKKAPSTKLNYTVNPSTYYLVPGDLATIYNFNPAFNAGYTGTGVTIVVVEDTDVYSEGDFGLLFRKEFGLARPYPNASLTQVHPPTGAGGFCSDPGLTPGNGAEAILDTQWASARRPRTLRSCWRPARTRRSVHRHAGQYDRVGRSRHRHLRRNHSRHSDRGRNQPQLQRNHDTGQQQLHGDLQRHQQHGGGRSRTPLPA
jgi:subtilase family serine protease